MMRFRMGIALAGGLIWAAAALGQDYPAREVSRPLLLPRSLMELDLSSTLFATNQVFDDKSAVTDAPGDYRLWEWLVELKYGVLDSVQFAARLPYLTGQLGETKGDGFGDLAGEFSFRFLNRPDLIQAAGLLRVSYPTGLHDNGYDIFAGRVVQTGWVTGDPGWDLYPGLSYKLIRPNWALEGRAEYWLRLSGPILQNVGVFQNTVNLDPGDGFYLRATGLYQAADKLALRLGAEFTSLGAGTLDGQRLNDQKQLLLLEPSALIQVNREADFFVGFGYTAWGRNTGSGFPWMFGFRSRF
jgi:hypothetical protein